MAVTWTALATGSATGTGGVASVSFAAVSIPVGAQIVIGVSCANSGLNGIAPTVTCADNSTEAGTANTYNQRSIVTNDPGAASAGATLAVFETVLTRELVSDVITVSFSPNVPEGCAVGYYGVSDSGETASYVTKGPEVTGNGTPAIAELISGNFLTGDVVFGFAALETDDVIVSDSDTDGGSWSSQLTEVADAGADTASMRIVSQRKTTTSGVSQSYTFPNSARDWAGVIIATRWTAASGDTLTPSLFTDADTFFGPTVAVGAVTLTPSLFTDGDTFFTPVLTRGSVTLTPSLFSDGDTFYSPTVAATYTLSPSLLSDADTVYAATITVGAITLSPSLFSDGDTFHAPTVLATYTLTPALFSDADTFFAPTVTVGEVTLTPSLFSDADTFYAPSISGAYTLTPSLFADDDAFYSATVTQGGVTLSPSLFSDDNTFYSATVTPGAVTLTPALFSDGDAFYGPAVFGDEALLAPDLFVDGDVFFAPTVEPGEVLLAPDLFVDGDEFYSPEIELGTGPEPEPVAPLGGGGASVSYGRLILERRRRKREAEQRRKEEEAALEAAKKLQRDIRKAQEGKLALARVEEQAERLDRLIAAQSTLEKRVEQVIGAIQDAQVKRAAREAELATAARIAKEIKESLERQIEEDEEESLLLLLH